MGSVIQPLRRRAKKQSDVLQIDSKRRLPSGHPRTEVTLGESTLEKVPCKQISGCWNYQQKRAELDTAGWVWGVLQTNNLLNH